ncbi:MAG: esterase family protein [Duncaniella sp.]|nr:esterase family protein [Duncaniella sp.]
MKHLLLLILLIFSLSATAVPRKEHRAWVDTLVVASAHLDSPMKVVVALPEGYLTPGNTRRYPTIYLLHGFKDDYRYYADRMPLDSVATAYQSIIVCPDGRDSWYWDSPVDPSMQMESFLTQDLVPTIDSLARTIPDPRMRAIHGLSMGGQGALRLAFLHPDIWYNAGSMSGGVDITLPKFHKQWRMEERLGSFDENPRRWGEHSVMSLVQGLKPGQNDIIFCCGTDDFFFDANNALSKNLNDHRIGHTYFTAPGHHNWQYWQSVIYPVLDHFRASFDRHGAEIGQ